MQIITPALMTASQYKNRVDKCISEVVDDSTSRMKLRMSEHYIEC